LAFVAAEDLLAASALEAEGTDCVHDSIDVTCVVDRYGCDLFVDAVAAGMFILWLKCSNCARDFWNGSAIEVVLSWTTHKLYGTTVKRKQLDILL